MPAPIDLHTTALVATIRFDQGYRYLDRCGEALVRLDDILDEGWIPTETTPSRGALRNYRLGMSAQFHSELMTVHQSEFISFEHFRDQACKIYEILWKTFEVKRIVTPVFRVILQAGFEEVEKADEYVRNMNLCKPDQKVLHLLGGHQSAATFTVCTQEQVTWQDSPVVRRRRLEVSVIRQERQPDFDERVMRRLPLVPMRQQSALGALMKLRRQHPKVYPVAAQFDLENAHECEGRSDTFNLSRFLDESWKWTEHVRTSIAD
jgi:hypothetical protein